MEVFLKNRSTSWNGPNGQAYTAVYVTFEGQN